MLLVSVALAVDVDITVHLNTTAARLREAPTVGLSAERLERRTSLLDALDSYASAGQFPDNAHLPEGRPAPSPVDGGMAWETGRTPVFVDDRGTHCAVGYLLAVDGREDLVEAAVERDVHGYVAELATPALVEWAEDAGFTLAELAAIQPSYEFLEREKEAPHVIEGFLKRMDSGKPCDVAAEGVHRMHFAAGMDLPKLGEKLRSRVAECALADPRRGGVFSSTLTHYHSRHGKNVALRPDECAALRAIKAASSKPPADARFALLYPVPTAIDQWLATCESPNEGS